MTPKVQVGTILIGSGPLVRQWRSRENNLRSRPLTAMPVEVFTHCFSAIGEALSRGIYDAIRPTATKR